MYFDDLSVFILYEALAFHKICVHQAHLVAREQTEIFLRRFFHKVIPLDIQFPAERNLPGSQFLILQVIGGIQVLYLTFRIIVDDQFDRIQHRHHTGSLHLQILPDAVLQHGIIHRTLALGYAAEIHKHLDRFRRESPAAERRDGHQARVVPAVYHSFFHQLFDVSLTRHHIGQIQLGKLDLPRRMGIFQLPHHPVVQRTVVFKFQRTDGMRDALDGVLDGMGEVVHGINTPFIAGIVMCHMRHTVDDRITHIHIGRGHVDLGAQHLLSVPIHAVLHVLEQFQVLFHAAVPVRAVLARLGQRAAVFPDLLRAQVADVCLSLFDQLHRSLIHLREIIRREEQPVLPVRAQPLDIFLDRLHELYLLLGRVRVVKTHIKLAVVLFCQPVV